MDTILLFVEANTTGTGMLALHKAQALGFQPVFLTNKPDRYLGLEQFDGPVITCDTNDLAALCKAIEKHFDPGRLAGVTTTSEFYVETVARLAARYGLPCNAPDAIAACRHKGRTRRILHSAGIQQPDFFDVASPDEIPAALAKIGLPCVVKPADDTGSYAVRLCHTAAEVEEQTRHILAMATNVRGQATARTALIESYLDAPEYSVEMFSWQGQALCLGITEKHLLPPPSFVEHRHIFPAPLPNDIATQIRESVALALAAVEFTHGPSHTEVKLTADGCAIVEINARLAGGMIPELITLVTGLDLLEQQCYAAVGRQPRLEHHTKGFAGIQFLVAPSAGTLREVRGVDAAAALDGIAEVRITARPGARVSPARSAYDRLGFVIAQGATYDETARRLEEATALIELIVQ